MASNRHLGRIIALQTLYEQDFRMGSGDKAFVLTEVLTRNIGRYHEQIDDTEFIEKLVNGVSRQQKQLDGKLQPVAPEWPLDQIARIDRVILRIGLLELEAGEVPPKAVINEAVELAKAFGGENSSKFVNGVLGTLLQGSEKPAKVKADKKPAKELTEQKASKKPAKVSKPKSVNSAKNLKADSKKS